MARPKKAKIESAPEQKPREVMASIERKDDLDAMPGHAPKPATLNGPMLLGDVQAALSDRYPHNDIHTMEGTTIEVKVPGGVILVDFKAVNKCKNTAELRAYIDALPIQ